MGSQQRKPRQRPFSWQDLDTPSDDPPVYFQQQQLQQQQHLQHPQQIQQQPQQPPNSIDTSINRGFSYAPTPTEHRAAYPADDIPLPLTSPTYVYNQQQQQQTQHQAEPQPKLQSPVAASPYPYPDEKAASRSQPLGSFSPVRTSIPSSIDTNLPAQSRHTRQRSNLSPINTNVGNYAPPPPLPPMPADLLPPKIIEPDHAPFTPISAGPTKRRLSEYNAPISPISGPIVSADQPYSPHSFRKPDQPNQPIFSPDAVFSPHSAHGPNGLDFSLHQPGQVKHPNMDISATTQSKKWKHGLCACAPDVSTCLTGMFCPCILYGRTSYRLSQKSSKKDPTDLLSYKSTNGSCLLMSAACGLWWMFPMMQRMRVRRMYKLDGGCADDVLKGCCCCCCVSVQNEREVREREENNRRWAGPASTEVYTSPAAGGMVYKPQN